VREEVYDASYYEADLLQWHVYSATLGLGKKSGRRRDIINHSKSSILRGYNIYQQRFAAQRSLLCQTGETQQRDEARLDQPELDTIVRASGVGIGSPYSYLPELAWLNKALRLMPGIKGFNVSCRRYHYRLVKREAYQSRHTALKTWPVQRRSTFSLEHDGDESTMAVVMDPRPWFPHDVGVTKELEVVWHRGFFVLQQAMAVLGLQNSTSMDLDIHRSPSESPRTRVLPAPMTLGRFHGPIGNRLALVYFQRQ